jgi:hypothetical protein
VSAACGLALAAWLAASAKSIEPKNARREKSKERSWPGKAAKAGQASVERGDIPGTIVKLGLMRTVGIADKQ